LPAPPIRCKGPSILFLRALISLFLLDRTIETEARGGAQARQYEQRTDTVIAELHHQTCEEFRAPSAQSGEKRSLDKGPCDTQPIGFNKGDGHTTKPDPEDDEIQPTGRPTSSTPSLLVQA
jgi:hypothetical protein